MLFFCVHQSVCNPLSDLPFQWLSGQYQTPGAHWYEEDDTGDIGTAHANEKAGFCLSNFYRLWAKI